MATLAFPPGGGSPLGKAQEKVVSFLAENLPAGQPQQTHRRGNAKSWDAGFIIIPNVVLPLPNGRQDLEIDVLVLTPHAFYIIEVKDWQPHIEVNDSFWVINGTLERPNPHFSLSYKCKALHSLLCDLAGPHYYKLWCQGVVVVAQSEVNLKVEGSRSPLTFGLNQGLIDFLQDPGRLPVHRAGLDGPLVVDPDEIKAVICRNMLPVRRAYRVIAGYEIEETLQVRYNLSEYLVRVNTEDANSSKRLRVIESPLQHNGLRPVMVERAIREHYRKLLELVSHPNILQFHFIHDSTGIGLVEVSDWFEHKTLQWYLRKNDWDLEQKLRILEGIALGLKHSHDAGIVHGDLKPANILISETLTPQIMNYNCIHLEKDLYMLLQMAVGEGRDRCFLAPEMHLPKQIYRLSASSDLYSLGVVFYLLLCGELPMEKRLEKGKAADGMPTRWLPSQRLPDLPKFLDSIVWRLCHPNKQCRYQSAHELLTDLSQHVCSTNVVHGHPREKSSSGKTDVSNIEGMLFKNTQGEDRRPGLEELDEIPAPDLSFMPGKGRATSGRIPGKCASDSGGSSGDDRTTSDEFHERQLRKVAQLFENGDWLNQLQRCGEIGRKEIVNSVNYVNFKEHCILVNIKELGSQRVKSLRAKVDPCIGESLDCTLDQGALSGHQFKSYEFLNLLLIKGQKLFLLKSELKAADDHKLSFKLPETCLEVRFAEADWHLCDYRHVQVELIQSGVAFTGRLLEFKANLFRVELDGAMPHSFQLLNPDVPVTVLLKNSAGIVFSGACTIVSQNLGSQKRTFVIASTTNNISRFRKKEFRSTRYSISPSPSVVFKHPLTNKEICLKVGDVSGSGFSVIEDNDYPVLVVGMIIPELRLRLANGCQIRCKAQVVHRNKIQLKQGMLNKCGIAILDMELKEQILLSQYLHRLTNDHAYVSNQIDPEELWRFFFESGFIYPGKYMFIYDNRDQFKKLYEKLYLDNPEIANHFVYQDANKIYAHISMLRTYENTWLFHHHASLGPRLNLGGLVVLDQISRYVNDFYCLYSTHMNFIICYFRPENRFPSRIFGGFYRYLNDPVGCSIVPFAYLHLPRGFEPLALSTARMERAETKLVDAGAAELKELEVSYDSCSQGGLLHAMDLTPEMLGEDNLSRIYQDLGFKRERHLLAVKKNGQLQALIMVNITDVGLNLSNLTNCVHFFVIDSNGLSSSLFYSTLSVVLDKYYGPGQKGCPVLIHPVEYAQKNFIAYEKVYNLWVLDIPRAGDRYLGYTTRLLKRIQRK